LSIADELNSIYNNIIEENRGVKLNKKSTLRIMQYISIFVLIGLAFGGLGIITNWTFFIPRSNNIDTSQAVAESALDIMIFNANPTSIALGQKADLIWTVSGATSVIIDPGIGSVEPAGKKTVMPDRTTSYTIVATNSTGTITRSVTIGVDVPAAPPIITTFTASVTNSTAGQPVTLKWSTRDATSANIDRGIGPVPVSGMQVVTPTVTTVYTLVAQNEGGTVTAQVKINIPTTNQPVIDSFTVTAYDYTSNTCNVTVGDPVIMRWNVLNASSVSIDQGIGVVAPSGVITLHPNANVIWTLMASNPAGAVTAYTSCNVTTISLPSIASFTVTPSSIRQGESASLKWSVTGAGAEPDTIKINQNIGTVDDFGALVVSPSASTTYTITAKNWQGSASASVVLTVIPTTHPTINSFIVSPATIKAGQSATLQWNVSGATSVTVTPNVGIVASTGNAKVSPAVTTVYTITASNAAGSITGYATITVNK